MRYADCNLDAPSLINEYDALHRRLDAVLRYALAAQAHDFPRRFAYLAETLEKSFAREDAWMEQIGYPAVRAHREQHARVLSAMHHVHCSLMAGHDGMARKVVSLLLPDWMYLHMETMDAALAAYMEAGGARRQGPARPGGHASGWLEFRQ